ncbi:MAG: hypothetical protein Q9192_007698, partial [Flavoplaca navasiana]
ANIGPSNKFADAMGKFAGVLKDITTEADNFEGELRKLYLELTKREMYIGFVLKLPSSPYTSLVSRRWPSTIDNRRRYDHLKPYVSPELHEATKSRKLALSNPNSLAMWLGLAEKAKLRNLNDLLSRHPVTLLYNFLQTRVAELGGNDANSASYTNHQDASKLFVENSKGIFGKLHGVVKDLNDIRCLLQGNGRVVEPPSGHAQIVSPDDTSSEDEDDLSTENDDDLCTRDEEDLSTGNEDDLSIEDEDDLSPLRTRTTFDGEDAQYDALERATILQSHWDAIVMLHRDSQ